MLTLLAFVLALGLLIAIHEYGHYRVAVACGIKVLKFSVGFGKPIFTWRRKNNPTEFSIGMLPLGGYVKMLDEREGPVDPAERHLAFNNQPLKSRAAVVAAGPIANLLLAVLLYAAVNWAGQLEAKAVLASPVAESVAERAGLRGGELVTFAAFEGEELQAVRSFEDLRWRLMQGALNGRDVRLGLSDRSAVGTEPDAIKRELVLELSKLDASQLDAQLFRKIGIVGPWTEPVIDGITAASPAAKAGLQRGDVVRKVNDRPVVDGQQLRELIRAAGVGASAAQTEVAQLWQIERAGRAMELTVAPELRQEANLRVARIGAYVGAPPEMVTVRYGLLDGALGGLRKTWDVSVLTVKMMGKMLIGEASLKNLSGPLTIADYAGKSAALGWTAYLLFLAAISVSLGVLNLLPLPVLDGGHLMYYLWEAVTGKSPSEAWMDRLQRGGIAVLLLMMSVALFNDVARLLG